MSETAIETLKRQAREIFGVDFSDQQVEIYRGRLPTMLQNVRLLEGWAARLDDTAPAQIQQTIEALSSKDRASKDAGR